MIEASLLRERIRGSLLGAAIGDALGSAFEFVGSSDIERAIGANFATDYLPAIATSLLAPRRPGNPTDDTAMTLALVDALVKSDPRSPNALLNGMVECLRRGGGPVADMFWNGGPGGACISMLRAAEDGASPFERINANAGGNGAAMRAHRCGCLLRPYVRSRTCLNASPPVTSRASRSRVGASSCFDRSRGYL